MNSTLSRHPSSKYDDVGKDATRLPNFVERYEYSAYGQRQDFFSPGSNDPGCYAPIGQSQVCNAVGTRFNAFGHQGLMHDEETGLVYNRARMLHAGLGRFMQQDPLGYADGMNDIADEAANPINRVDPTGNFWGFLIDAGFAIYDTYQYSTGKISGAEYTGRMMLTGSAVVLDLVSAGTAGGDALAVGRVAARTVEVASAAQKAANAARAANAGMHAIDAARGAGASGNSSRSTPTGSGAGEGMSQSAKRGLAKEKGGIPRSAQPKAQGTYIDRATGAKTSWWEYTDSCGNRKIVIEHPDGSVHVGTPKPQSTHLDGGVPKYYPEPGTGHIGDD